MTKARLLSLLTASAMCIATLGACATGESSPTGKGEHPNPSRVLAIGNSFSDDALWNLPAIAKTLGVEDLVIADLYIGSATLDLHANAAVSGYEGYDYNKAEGQEWVTQPRTASIDAILDEDWDVITLQQGSGLSGLEETYNEDLTDPVEFVKDNSTNPDLGIGWHMTWAYQGDSSRNEFGNYDDDQMVMYEGIVNAVQEKVVPNESFAYIIPVGTVMQNIRTSAIGDTLTRDGQHLDMGFGRDVAALTWLYTLTDRDLEGIEGDLRLLDMDPERIEIVAQAVRAAIENPFEVTDLSQL